MSKIEERIAKHERLLVMVRATYTRASDIKAKAEGKIKYHDTAIANLKAKLAKQQTKDQAIGKALVESGAITEEQKEAVEKLLLPEDNKVI